MLPRRASPAPYQRAADDASDDEFAPPPPSVASSRCSVASSRWRDWRGDDPTPQRRRTGLGAYRAAKIASAALNCVCLLMYVGLFRANWSMMAILAFIAPLYCFSTFTGFVLRWHVSDTRSPGATPSLDELPGFFGLEPHRGVLILQPVDQGIDQGHGTN